MMKPRLDIRDLPESEFNSHYWLFTSDVTDTCSFLQGPAGKSNLVPENMWMRLFLVLKRVFCGDFPEVSKQETLLRWLTPLRLLQVVEHAGKTEQALGWHFNIAALNKLLESEQCVKRYRVNWQDHPQWWMQYNVRKMFCDRELQVMRGPI